MTDNIINLALEKSAKGERLSPSEALSLINLVTSDGIHLLGEAALANRRKRFGKKATYVSNAAINPSNICEGKCSFCGYRADEGDDHAYSLDEKDIFSKIEKTSPVQVHIVGGMNDIWHFNRYVKLITNIRKRWPDIHIKAFTAVEINNFAEKEKKNVPEILSNLKNAGLESLTGGGAEIFSKRMRDKYCPDKLSPDGWLNIHQSAHELELTTNATMLFGMDETQTEWIDHLLMLRNQQDKSGGFSCFIPLAFQPGKDSDNCNNANPLITLAVISISRLILDNFSHIKAYWPMIGLETASVALSYGADDLDGTLGEERIAHAAGAQTPKALTRTLMEKTIRAGGFEPLERSGLFNRM